MHELTKKLYFLDGGGEEFDQIVTAYMKERAEWLVINAHYRTEEVYGIPKKLIDQAFGIEKESLEDKFKDKIISSGGGATTVGYIVNEEISSKLAQIAKAHFKANPHELKEGE